MTAAASVSFAMCPFTVRLSSQEFVDAHEPVAPR